MISHATNAVIRDCMQETHDYVTSLHMRNAKTGFLQICAVISILLL
jgi:hypothetical protein